MVCFLFQMHVKVESCPQKNPHKNTIHPRIPIDQLISSKEIQDAFEVRPRTVRRWSKAYGWREHRFSHKVLRYLREDVEESMGVSFTKEAEV